MKKLIALFLLFISMVMNSQTTPGEYEIKILDVNTKYSDFGTTFFGKDKVIFASPKDNAVLTRTTWDGNKQPFLDLYQGTIDENNQIVNKRRILGDINTKFHEGVVAFTKDLKIVYYSANNTQGGKAKKDSTGIVNIQLYKADVADNGSWKNIVKLPFNNDQYSTGHPTLSLDDKKLYFISDRPESIGKTDIYVVNVEEDGTYSQPQNLGPRINTEEREMFPFISDENILYFSSNGLPGYGDLDVFASKIFDNTVALPINLEDPVNSKKDDFAYIIDDTKLKGFFSSNRKGGKGDDDIYTFTADPGIYFECNQEITGIARDKDTQELLPGAKIVLLDIEGKELETKFANEEDASFSFELPCDTAFKIVTTNQGYLLEEIDARTANDIDVDPLELMLDLAPELKVVAEKIMININTIYFDFDKWNIRPDAAKELDKVIAVMMEHPSMLIEGGSHTDSRATEAYNDRLSSKRAKATMDYIIAGGVDPNRITSKGYGETHLVNNCSSFVKGCTREQHQLNRRTEFVIVNDNDRFVSTAATLDDIVIGGDHMTKVSVDAVRQIETQTRSSRINAKSLHHIIAGAYKDPKNAIKKVNELKRLGYDPIILEMKDSGLSQVTYNSYYNKQKALDELSRIKETRDSSAWLLSKTFESVKAGDSDSASDLSETVDQNDKLNNTNPNFIQIPPIYFGFDKWSLSNGELLQLDNVVKIMKDNPAIIVEAGAHTDSKNIEAYNQILSDKRAKSVVDYILSKGINPLRISGKGYGETRYVNRCRSIIKCSAQEQQENRRIEFMIIDGNGYPEQDIFGEENKRISTNPIYFDYDKFDIRKDAEYELKRVVKILNNSPSMVIEAGSHTDTNNTEGYNQILSENRAKSVKNYLVSNGINADRIISKGYGELELTNECKSFVKCTPEQHQANRRTEFRIVKM